MRVRGMRIAMVLLGPILVWGTARAAPPLVYKAYTFLGDYNPVLKHVSWEGTHWIDHEPFSGYEQHGAQFWGWVDSEFDFDSRSLTISVRQTFDCVMYPDQGYNTFGSHRKEYSVYLHARGTPGSALVSVSNLNWSGHLVGQTLVGPVRKSAGVSARDYYSWNDHQGLYDSWTDFDTSFDSFPTWGGDVRTQSYPARIDAYGLTYSFLEGFYIDNYCNADCGGYYGVSARSYAVGNLAVDFRVIAAPPGRVIDAKECPDGFQVDIPGGVVSAVFGDAFYISDSGVAGIKVSKANHGLEVGQVVDVIGTMCTDAARERYVDADSATPSGSGSPRPLGMTCRSLGGSGFAYSHSSGAGQAGVDGGAGLNNIGLLVKVCGSVKAVDPAATPLWFDLEDGSSCPDPDSLPPLMPKQVRVRVQLAAGVAPPDPGQIVTVTGISSCYLEDTKLLRRILTRDSDDIVPAE